MVPGSSPGGPTKITGTFQTLSGDCQSLSRLKDFFSDRTLVNSALIVLSFVSVFILTSQSAASYPTYLLAIAMLFSFRIWKGIFQQRILWTVMALLGWLVISSLWSRPFEVRDLASVAARALLVFLFVIAFAECQAQGLLNRWLGKSLVVAGMLAAVAAIWVFYGDSRPYVNRLRGLGQLHSGVIAALVYGVVLLFALDIVAETRERWWRVCSSLCACVMGYAIYLSDSRNAWVSVIMGIGVFALSTSVAQKKRFVVLVGAMGLVTLGFLVALVIDVDTRSMVLPRGDSNRLAIWTSTLEQISSGSVWIGLGINTSDNVTIAGREIFHPHSMYLSVFRQGGIVAITLFLMLIWQTLAHLMAHYERREAKLALGVLVIGLSAYVVDGHELIDKVGSTWLLLWFPVSAALGFSGERPPTKIDKRSLTPGRLTDIKEK